MMAGMAIALSLKMKGLDAIAIACAAFCIPTSITIVFCSLPLSFVSFDKRAPARMERISRAVTEPPRIAKLSAIVTRCCTKYDPARKTKAGKAHFERIFSRRVAVLWAYFLTTIPKMIGRSIRRRFCTRRFPTGRCISVPVIPEAATARFKIIGIVKRVIILLKAVNETDRGTSPLANIEKMLDELPPGQQAIRMSPI